jgi:hypothetical protein
MRGHRVSRDIKKLDVVITAVRFQANGKRLALARGYERHGAVWSDLKLYERKDLIELLKAKRRVSTGRRKQLPGDFEALATVRLAHLNGKQVVIAGETKAARDDLGLPVF